MAHGDNFNEGYLKYLSGLKSKDTSVQLKTVREFYTSLLNDLKQLKREEETLFIDSLITLIKKLDNDNSDTSDKQACILVITSILNLDNINVRASKVHQQTLFIHLRNLLTCSEPLIIQMASRAIGRLVLAGVECNVEFKNALENLRNDTRRLAGIICIRELALVSPTKLFLNSSMFFQDIMIAITDKTASIRHEACELFRLALHIIITREVSVMRTNTPIRENTSISLRRSSTASSFTNSEESLHSSMASVSVSLAPTGSTSTSTTTQPTVNDYFFTLQYKYCFENSLKELEASLNGIFGISGSKKDHTSVFLSKIHPREEIVHGYLLIILEILKFSSLQFEKEIEKYISLYITHSQEAENQLKICEDLHVHNLKALIPYNFEPATDPFLFLFKSEKINIKLESKNCYNFINEKYECLHACITRLFSFSNINIQQALLQLIPRLANFDKQRFSKFYLSDSISYLSTILAKKWNLMKPEALFSVGLLSLAMGTTHFLDYAHKFIEIIRLNSLINSKDAQKKRVINSTTLTSSISLGSIVLNGTDKLSTVIGGITSSGLTSGINTPITSTLSRYGFYNITGSTSNANSQNVNNVVVGLSNGHYEELNSILACISMFAKSMPFEMIDYILEILEPLMITSGGVTHTMRCFLTEILQHVPQLRRAIHENLLKIISQILIKKPFCQVVSSTQQESTTGLNAYVTNTSNDSGTVATDYQSNTSDKRVALNSYASQSSTSNILDDNLIIEALQTLRSFRFTSTYQISFLQNCINFYLIHDSYKIKVEAVLTIGKLLSSLIQIHERRPSRSLLITVSCAVKKLIESALIDTEADVRYHIINTINFIHFNYFLIVPANVNRIGTLLRDERVEIRELSASVLSRLGKISPAYAQPQILTMLEKLLFEVELHPELSKKEESVRLIGHLLSNVPRLVRVLAKRVLDNLLSKLNMYQNDIRFASSIITIVGQLASQSGADELDHFEPLIPFLIESMRDFYYIQLKHTSLWTIGQIIQNTGYVIEPYKKYPELLNVLLSFLQTETSTKVRHETMRTLGIIGAIDPLEYKRNAMLKSITSPDDLNTIDHNCETKYPVATESKLAVLEPYEILMSSHLDEYYPAMTVDILMKIVKTAIAVNPRKDAIQALVFAMRVLDTRSSNYVEYIMPTFLEIIKNVNDNVAIDTIMQLGLLVTYIKKSIDPYVDEIIKIVEFYWSMNEKQTFVGTLIDLMQSIVNVMDFDFKNYLPKFLPLVLKKLEREIHNNKTTNVNKLLNLLRSLAQCMGNYFHLILPSLTASLNNKITDRGIKQEIMFTLYTYAKHMTLTEYIAMIFQCFVRLFEQYPTTINQLPLQTQTFTSCISTQKGVSVIVVPSSLTSLKINGHSDLISLVLETLYIIARQVGQPFSIYKQMFDKVLAKSKTYCKLYEHMLSCYNEALNLSTNSQSASQAIHEEGSSAATNRHQATKPTEPMVPTTTNSVDSKEKIYIENVKARYEKAEQLVSRDEWRERYNYFFYLIFDFTHIHFFKISFRKFKIVVVEETPQPSLKTCSLIAHDSVPQDLFNVCFMSVFIKVTPTQIAELERYLDLALRNSDVHDIIKSILNLSEYMERCEITFRLDRRLLAEKAFSVRAYAKSLHYVEQEFASSTQPSSEILEQLVTLNHELQRTEAAAGVLDYGNKYFKNLDMRVKERWYEKLHDWSKALNAYEKELNLEQPAVLSAASANLSGFQTDPKTLTAAKLELLLGKMRCLKGLGDWAKLKNVCNDIISCISQLTPIRDDNNDERPEERASIFPISPIQPSPQVAVHKKRISNINDHQILLTHQQQQNLKSKIAEMGAAASWGLSDWNSMDTYVRMLPEKSYEGSLYRAVLSVNKNDFESTLMHIEDTREILDVDLTSMAFQSYDRAYQAIIETQVLSELEEIITYKKNEEKRSDFEKIWWKRLQGCEKSVEYWHRLLLVRSIVLPKIKNLKSWLKLSTIAQKSGHLSLSGQILGSLLAENADSEVCKYAYLKYSWACNFKEDAYNQLAEFVSKTMHPLRDQVAHSINITKANNGTLVQLHEQFEKKTEIDKLLSKCYLKMGRWQYELEEGMNDKNIYQIISYYQLAKDYNKDWYKAWNAWSNANYKAIQYYKMNPANNISASRSSSNSSTAFGSFLNTNENLNQFIKPAMIGFIGCIKLSPKTALQETNCLQDTLRLLTLVFDYCTSKELYDTMLNGINTTPLEIWLQVIPQLIARIDSSKEYVQKLIQKLLCDLGAIHPQAVVYRLILASKCSNGATPGATSTTAINSAMESKRNKNALIVLESLKEHSNLLVEQAKLVSEELIRGAILWHEQWHGGLEDASRQYFTERNIKGMLDTVEVLHTMMDRGPTTGNESAFLQNYGTDLNEAREYCSRFKESKFSRDIETAWDKYYLVFRKITKQLPTMTSLELSFVTPRLVIENELELAVPGTYEPNRPLVKIKSFYQNIQVITSKQRPRKISIHGSNGREYVFLLKGHEDLRQDERVMQIFGLVNNLLLKNHETARRDLAIQRFSVIPLSQNSGLIEWLMNCDTIHYLIKEYRDKKKVQLNFEHRIITRLAPDYEHLTTIQKIEIFEAALDNSAGDDLAKILWTKSVTAEKWLERRTNYTRSLAVMSMVGYIIGLGDRHPSNLMLDRKNGKIIHVDFGDCFETAMTREKFPEKIPFRLTRMLKNATEVTGIEGTFRHTCEAVMKVLRDNRESVIAVLEAFVYDPLFSWKFVDGNNNNNPTHNNTNNYNNNNNDNTSLSNNTYSAMTASNTHNSSNINLINTNANLSAIENDRHYLNNSLLVDDGGEEINRKALRLINRVRDKLTGYDFGDKDVDVKTQVDLLIKQATSSENLCQCFIGWCAWW